MRTEIVVSRGIEHEGPEISFNNDKEARPLVPFKDINMAVAHFDTLPKTRLGKVIYRFDASDRMEITDKTYFRNCVLPG